MFKLLFSLISLILRWTFIFVCCWIIGTSIGVFINRKTAK